LEGTEALENVKTNSVQGKSQNFLAENRLGSNLVFAAVILLALLLIIPPVVKTPFFSKGEAREALAGQAVFSQGEWILPRRYGEEIITKPPATYWMMAALASLTGSISEPVARGPSVIFCLVSLGALFSVCAKKTSKTHGIVSILLLLFSPFWLRSAITARVDMPLSGAFFCTLSFLYCWAESSTNKRVYLVLITLSLTVATLIKGPVAIVLSFSILFIYLCSQRVHVKENVLRSVKIIFPSVLCSSLWYLAALYQGGQEFLSTFLLENVSRLSGTMSSAGKQPHEHSVFYLWSTLFIGFAPFSLTIFFFPKDTFKSLCSTLASRKAKEVFTSLKGHVTNLPRFILFSGVVTFVFLVFFSIPASKRAEYLLPCYPFIACLAGYYILLHKEFFLPRFHSILKYINYLACILYLIGIVALLGGAAFSSLLGMSLPLPLKLLSAAAASAFHSSGGILVFAPLPSFACLYYLSNRLTHAQKTKGLILNYLLILITSFSFWAPAFAEQLSPRSFAATVRSTLPSVKNFYSIDYLYELNYYLDGQIQAIKVSQLIHTPNSFAVLRLKRLEELLNQAHAEGVTIKELLRSEKSMRKVKDKLVLVEIK
jgi:4-amino-4-deoxy-L-arabinose transferase-like glycosyltransferase